MFKALLIGCGNIGALYDLETQDVLTHAKAYAQHPGFSLTVFDPNKELETRIAITYHATIAQPIDEVYLKQFHCVSICSPTQTHVAWLHMAIQAGVPVVICEKPVSNNSEELTALAASYQEGNTKILVNYIRRFQPAFIALKQIISEWMEQETLTNVAIRYQRGFINNASHAFDLLQFLLNKLINLEHVKISHAIYDHFLHDPTLTLTATWGQAGFNAMGLTNVKFSNFEIDLYFHIYKILITDAGKTIRILEAPVKGTYLQPLAEKELWQNCIADYMKPVIQHAFSLLEGSSTADNFQQSVTLNQQMLKYLSLGYDSTSN
jgi:predicted dehydrogenase